MAAGARADEIAATPGVAARDWVELGRVLRPHGLAGDLLVALHSDDPTNLLEAPTVALRAAPGTIPFAVEEASAAGAAGGRVRLRLHLSGIETREQTQPWIGAAVLVAPESLQALPEGEFYWRDLIGLEARAAGGAPLGRVAELVATGGADLLVIRRDGRRDLLLPVVSEWLVRVDRERGELWLDPPAELLAEAER